MMDVTLSNVISKAGLKCPFNVNSSKTKRKKQIQEYYLNRGHEIAVHGANHRADGKMIYHFDIWFDVDGELYCIKSGETKKSVAFNLCIGVEKPLVPEKSFRSPT